MIRTRVGYAGGTTPSPTYRSISDYTETTQVDFDPKVITYDQLLDEFFDGHNAYTSSSKQYASAIFYHDDAQKAAAEAAFEARAQKGRRPTTTISRAGTFYSGEHYHHKYYLQRYPEIVEALMRLEGLKPSGSTDVLADSAILTKFNGYVGSNGSKRDFEADLERFGIPADLSADLRRVCRM